MKERKRNKSENVNKNKYYCKYVFRILKSIAIVIIIIIIKKKKRIIIIIWYQKQVIAEVIYMEK